VVHYREISEGKVGRMAVRRIAHPSIDERRSKGLEARDRTSVSSHTKWGRPQTALTRLPCWKSRMSGRLEAIEGV